MKEYIIDGKNFSSLESFYEEISKNLIPSADWGHNLDAFNDILRGGYGTPSEGFELIWKNYELSKNQLGYPETLKWLRKKIKTCHPLNRETVRKEIMQAEQKQGFTLFDIIVDIIRDHENINFKPED